MGIVSENPLPECENDEELANSFVKFFLNKIQKIRDDLDSYPLYYPPVHNMTLIWMHSMKLMNIWLSK